MAQVSVIVPAYNEQEALSEVLDSLAKIMEETGYPYEIIVVDDGSKDQTAQLAQAKSGVVLIQHPYNKGTGAARTTGLKHATGDIIVMIDGDGTYPVYEIPHLLKYLPEHDMVVGARKKETGSHRFLRAGVKFFIRKLASYISGHPIPDLNSGLRAFKKEVALQFLKYLPSTHSWVSTITIAFLVNDYNVKFIPIDYFKRKGKSSFHPIIDTYNYFMLVLRTMMYFKPLRVFLPLSLFLLCLGMVKSMIDMWLGSLQESDVIIFTVAFLIGVLGLLADLIAVESKK